ncbi:MAG: hypothetical protein U0235_23735 [Polyangiaceae bacterium]
MDRDRPLLVLVSDIHLTDALHGASIPRADTFERFWLRIDAARGARPAHLCFVGDLFDIVRSPSWLDTALRPYHEPSAELAAHVDRIVAAMIERERPFFDAVRKRVESGALAIDYVLGNHDRLLRIAPAARRRVWAALTGQDRDVDFPSERYFPEHRVVAYHGHVADDVNFDPDGGGTLGDAIGSELIVGFPRAVRASVGHALPELDDIDDVRPIYAVPAWVRSFGIFHAPVLREIHSTWSGLVEGFLGSTFVRDWSRRRHRAFSLDTGLKLRLLLELSTKRLVAKGSDRRLTELYKYMQHGFDAKMARVATENLTARTGARYVVNGHSHFASVKPLGSIDGRPAVYFNTGTWRSVHQIGHGVGGRPAFLPYDAMTYLVFFPDGDPMGRDYEWWTGGMVPREREA